MITSINNPVQATQIFLVLLVLVLIITLRKRKSFEGLSVNLTQELKGFAILAIVFSHISYSLFNENKFLFPLNIAAGVGVNLFLFLSGYGLVMSALKKPLPVFQFYKRRLLKLYPPFWLTIILFLGLDFFILSRTYSLSYIGQALIGFFSRADITMDLNSPLWYFTIIVFYYFLFPLVFWRKQPWISAIILYLIGYLIIRENPDSIWRVIHLYKLHILAFPLGVLIGSLVFNYKGSWLEIQVNNIWPKITRLKFINIAIYCVFIAFLSWLVGYTAYFSHVGDKRWIEETVSLVTGGALILLFLIKKIESRLLYWFGFFSYEVYLLHWPILSRFDIFYFWLPAWMATILYLVFFLGISWSMRWLISKIKILN
jgi:peptidoglycan/LPS O-acetylase OafA/YrhL